jgi:sec-independent protein translocase protein TatC
MKEMSFWEHVEELRKVLMRIVWIFAISFVITTYFVDNITEFLLAPIRQSLAENHSGILVYHSVFEKAWVQVDVAIWWAIMFSSPLWFYQIWRFIKPGLYVHELRAVKPFMIFGWFLFIAGMCFGYFVAFPAVFSFLSKIGVSGIEANINLRDYVSTSSQILLFLGIIFQVPNIILILGFMGIVTKQSLRSLRRYIYVGLALFAAIFSPPDVISMLGVWVPCCLLFEVGVLLVAYIVHPYLHRVHMKEHEEQK